MVSFHVTAGGFAEPVQSVRPLGPPLKLTSRAVPIDFPGINVTTSDNPEQVSNRQSHFRFNLCGSNMLNLYRWWWWW